MKYTKRVAEVAAKRYLKAFPVLGLTGPRQSGKSTLLKHLLPDYTYVTFDDLHKIELFEEDPVGFMKKYQKRVIFDEVQNVPKIFNAIKIVVDEDRQNYGNFVLTGSSQFSFLKSASESLAGRIGLLSLLPFQCSEVDTKQRNASIFKGAYPELVLRDYFESEAWYASYVDTYLNKDLRSLAQIGDVSDFRRFIRLLAAQVGNTLEYSHYAKDLGLSVPTIKRWISILEASYVIFLLPPFFNNLGKRIIKSPKLYFYDTGLVSYLTGISTFKQYDGGPLAGPLFENYVVSESLKRERHTATDAQLYYLRTTGKQEIDLIIDRKTHREFIEIKKSATFKSAMTNTLSRLVPEGDKAILVYQGASESYKEVDLRNVNDYLLNN
ncbi:MAG: hypothetical protein SP1CHLAM54_16980 [Chlamydiia bacterium]|nr:hypothetical protein [Chlamydiia bacterium]MCH9616586.1 hypothetical protein [Chlamydiia bacterium]MCH9629316.1 hypothetical protein [Chlamydiia bacterium]